MALSIARATKWLQQHADETRIVYKNNTMLGLAEAAAAGVGLALLPCYIGTAVPRLATSRPLPDLESELWLITLPDLRNTARVRAFLDFCGDEIARRQPALAGVAPVSCGITVGRSELGGISDPPGNELEAVVLNLMNPVRPDGGRSAGNGRHGSMKRRTVGIASRYIAPAVP